MIIYPIKYGRVTMDNEVTNKLKFPIINRSLCLSEYLISLKKLDPLGFLNSEVSDSTVLPFLFSSDIF